MKQNLKEYTENINLPLETKIFSKEDCNKIIKTLIERKDLWENRSPIGDFFNTYGALTYLDKDDKKYLEFSKRPWFKNNKIPKIIKVKEKNLIEFYKKILES